MGTGRERKLGTEMGLRRRLSDEIHDLRQFDIQEIRDLYQAQLDRFGLVRTSNFYLYSFEEQELEDDEIPSMEWDTMIVFYRNVISNAEEFADAEASLLAEGKDLKGGRVGVSDQVRVSEGFLSSCYILVRNLRAMNVARAVPFMTASQLFGVQQFQLKKFLEEIGTEKPETFRETMRRYIPRYLWFPIPPPEGQVASGDEVRLREVWRECASCDRSLLIHPDNIELGRVTLHVLLVAAEKVEAEGCDDLGYFLRTYGILSILAMEAERGAAEIPFFTHIFGGLVTGEVHRAPKDAYFDFQSAIGRTMRLTFSRLQDELEHGEMGRAANFLHDLAYYYSENIPEMLARSIIRHGGGTANDFDALAVLRGLGGIDFGWAKGLLERVAEIPERRIIKTDEVVDLAEAISGEVKNNTLSPERFAEDVSLIIGEEDSYGFNVLLSRLGLSMEGMKSVIEIELNAVSESIKIVLKVGDGQVARFLPFELSLSGDRESIMVETLGKEPLVDQTLETYRNLVAKAMRHEADKLRWQQSGTKAQLNQTVPRVKPQALELQARPLTRLERMARYEEMKEQLRVERKRRRQRPSEATEVACSEAATREAAERGTVREIVGLERENVERLLKEEKIEAVTTDQVIGKLTHFLEMARVSKKMLGKGVNMEYYGRGAKGLNLRQMNWVLDGGATAMRIYLQDVGSGKFLLCGILLKKSDSMQNRFIRNLVAQIL